MATPKLPFHPCFSSLLLLLNRLLRILQIKHSASFGDLLAPFDSEDGTSLFKQAPGEEVVCVFCMSDVADGEEVRRLRCSHLFHSSCLGNWVEQRRADCPLCRRSLLVVLESEMEAEEADESAPPLLAFVQSQWWAAVRLLGEQLSS